MVIIQPAQEAKVSKVECPACHERVPRIGLLLNSEVKGVTFKCKRCSRIWEIKTTQDTGKT